MQIIAVVGLAQNFAALRSLVTTGIQKGHMKMHLANILNKLEATSLEAKQSLQYFENKAISYNALTTYLNQLREIN